MTCQFTEVDEATGEPQSACDQPGTWRFFLAGRETFACDPHAPTHLGIEMERVS